VAADRRPHRRAGPAKGITPPSGEERSVLALSLASREVRRQVGFLAWAVLEDVALDAHHHPDGQLVAETNVRRVAAHLGIAKDTAARALVRLAGTGLVTRDDRGRGISGSFARSCYSIQLDVAIGLVHLEDASSPSTGAGQASVVVRRPMNSDTGVHDRAVARPRSDRRAKTIGPALHQDALFDAAADAQGLR
jgi:hypothetical protein